jgi:hypothetical protein
LFTSIAHAVLVQERVDQGQQQRGTTRVLEDEDLEPINDGRAIPNAALRAPLRVHGVSPQDSSGGRSCA